MLTSSRWIRPPNLWIGCPCDLQFTAMSKNSISIIIERPAEMKSISIQFDQRNMQYIAYFVYDFIFNILEEIIW